MVGLATEAPRPRGARRLPLIRFVKFGLIGSTCFGIQMAIMLLLTWQLGVHESAANAAGFWSSAQANFWLSRTFTWGDRKRAGTASRQWLVYNAVAGLSLGVNAAAFWLARMVVPLGWAALIAVVATTMSTFVMHHFGTFRRRGMEAPSPSEVKQLASVGISFFMPGKNEGGNLEGAVRDVSETLDAIGAPHTIIVVDDGSTDDTPYVVARLKERYAALRCIRHEHNRGYGAALRTGFAASYATGHGFIAFFDADRQFQAQDLVTLLTRMIQTDADVVVGNRAHRADSLKRKVMGVGWHWLSRLTLGFRIRDVDCGFKLFRREVFDRILPHLDAEYAAISPQLMTLLTRSGFRIAEADVEHFSRAHGEQTGSNRGVVVRSLEELVRIRRAADAFLVNEGLMLQGRNRWLRLLPMTWAVSMMVKVLKGPERPQGPQAVTPPRRGWWRRMDPAVRLVALVATGLSVSAFVYFQRQGAILAYTDALSHMLIARRVVDSPTSGLAQLGGVWLPLPHLLALPLVWWDAAYYNGICGSVVSMASYVLAGVFMCKLGWRLTGNRLGGLVTAGIFLLNPNTLYMQSTPMTEMLLLAGMAGSVYALLRWVQTDNYLYLIGAAAAAFLATLTRYEGWVLLAALTVTMIYIGIRQRYGWAKFEATITAFMLLAGAGVICWMIWNQLILGDWLAFQRGKYAKPSLWVGSNEPAVGHLGVALETYGYATLHNLTLPIVVLAAMGLVVYLWRTRLSAEAAVPMALVAFFPFFVLALYKGQRPLHVSEVHNALYNVRFGLVMLLPAAVFCGYFVVTLAGIIRWPRVRPAPAAVALILVAVMGGMAVRGDKVITLNEPMAERSGAWSQRALAASAFLRQNYHGGLVLMESFGNELVVFMSRIPSGNHIYEGSYRLWEPALADPVGHKIDWVYMRQTPGSEDNVFLAMKGTERLQGYQVVYEDVDRVIYASLPVVEAFGQDRMTRVNKEEIDTTGPEPGRHVNPEPEVTTEPPKPVPLAPRVITATVTCDRLLVRSAPTSQSPKLGSLVRGQRASVLESVVGSDPYGDGRNRWLKLASGSYVWSFCTDFRQHPADDT